MGILSVDGNSTSSDTSNLVVYSVFKTPVSYIGELLNEGTDEVRLGKVLMLLQGQNDAVQIGAVPFASRESEITLRYRDLPGFLIRNIDADLKETYKKDIYACYSKLKLG